MGFHGEFVVVEEGFIEVMMMACGWCLMTLLS